MKLACYLSAWLAGFPGWPAACVCWLAVLASWLFGLGGCVALFTGWLDLQTGFAGWLAG